MSKGKKQRALQKRLTRAEEKLALLSSVPHTPRYLPFSYQYGFQKGRSLGSHWNGLSFDLLREVAKRCLLIKAIHSARFHQIEHIARPWNGKKGEVGFRVIHKDEYNPDVQVEKIPKIKERCAKVMAQLETPHPIYNPTFSGFCTKLTADFLTINRPTVELIRNERGEVKQFAAVDGAIVVPTLQYLRQFSSKSNFPESTSSEELLEKVFNAQQIDLSGAEWVIVREGVVESYAPPGRIFIAPLEKTTDIREVDYPPSYVEDSVIGIVSFCNAFSYNSQYFERGNMAEIILGISGDYDDDSLSAFQDQLREGHSGLLGAWRVPIIPMSNPEMLKVFDLKKSNRDMQFLQFLNVNVSLVTANYRMHPSTINFVGMSTEGTAIFEHSKEVEIETAKEEGFHTLAGHIGLLCDRVVRSIDPDLRFEWVGLTEEKEAQEAELISKEISTWRSIDEVRIAKGKEPFEEWWSGVPANPTIFSFIAQTEIQKQGQNGQGQNQADFGRETGFGAESESPNHEEENSASESQTQERPRLEAGIVGQRGESGELGKALTLDDLLVFAVD